MLKKLSIICLSILLTLLSFNFDSKATFIYADDDNSVCDSESENYDADACVLLAREKSDSITKLQDEISAAEDDLQEAQELITKYANEASKLQVEIDELKVEIDELKVRIEELTEQIAENEAEVEALNTRVKNRMVESQKTMHFNGYLDFLLGSKSFSDLLRRVYGVSAILSKDENDRALYLELISQLSEDKFELEESKKKLDENYDLLTEKRAEFLIMKAFYDEVAAEAERLIEERQAELDNIKESYSDLISVISASNEIISKLANSSGFVSAVHNSYICDTPWYYSDNFLGGKAHLGVDYAASYGTELHAPASGVVLRADDSCGYGYLGNYCGAWIAGGGNQVYLMCSVNDSIYGFMFFHLSEVDVERGDIVMADDVIGKVGSSGSSTGPHCHIEMYYLGDGTLSEYLGMTWNSTFYCGRGETAISNRCEIGNSAPCILNPVYYLS